MVRLVVFLFFSAAVLLVSAASPAAPADPPAKAEPKKPGGFDGRTGTGKKRLLERFGGSAESEEAVMLGLAWLTQEQRKDGSWAFEFENTKNETAAATGLAMLSFLGAGQSHKEGRYKQTVQAGLDWLVKNVDMTQGVTHGRFRGAKLEWEMYSQGIATLALCEAYGLTHDAAIRPVAQAAIDYIQRAQDGNGGWRYHRGALPAGDTSIVGWQIQALHAAQLTQDLRVDDRVIKKAIAFLDSAGAGKYKSVYGYIGNAGAAPGTSRTAIGLLCRYYIDGWRTDHPGFHEGTQGLMTRAPSATPARPPLDLYYYYYATQVVRFHGGEEWRTWNEGARQPDGTRSGGVPAWLIDFQVRTPANRGSWDIPEEAQPGRYMNDFCGRLGTTCFCLLTLEVYYRYSPEDNQNAGQK